MKRYEPENKFNADKTGLFYRQTKMYKIQLIAKTERVLTDEKLDEIGFRLERSPQKSLCRLAQQVGVSKTSVQIPEKKYVR